MPDAATTNPPATVPTTSSLGARLLDIFVTPGEVFDEVIASPPCAANWRVPMTLVCLAGILALQFVSRENTAATVGQIAGERGLSVVETQMLAGSIPLVSALMVCFTAVTGTFWSAFVLWFIGRIFLKVRFSFLKTLEVVGLTSMILGLGTVVTTLLIAATGDAAARPALSLLAGKTDPASAMHRLLDTLNFFNLWTTAVLSIGLSRLSGVTFKEAAFWVLGFWLFARIALIILA